MRTERAWTTLFVASAVASVLVLAGSCAAAQGATSTIRPSSSSAKGEVNLAGHIDASAITPTLSYVALGDSFSSGAGNKAAGWVNQSGVADKSPIARDGCNRSSLSYPGLTSAWLARRTSVPLMSFSFLACSGATTTDLWSGSASVSSGLEGASGDHGEGEQLPSTPLSNAHIVTLTVGRDDLNFGGVLSNCYLHACSAESTNKWIANLKQNIQNLQTSLLYTYEQVAHDAPTRRST